MIDLTTTKLTESQMDDFQKCFEHSISYYEDEISRIEKELAVTHACAKDIVYLRTRPHWESQLERRIIEFHKTHVQLEKTN